MALEKRWAAIPPRSLTANGTAAGDVTLDSIDGLFVKQLILLSSNAQPAVQLQIKRIVGSTISLGPPTGNIDSRTNVSLFTTAQAANLSAKEQLRPTIGPEDFQRAVYEEEPAVALRTILVDHLGDPLGQSAANPVKVELSGGSIELGSVKVEDLDGDTLGVNPDGSINVNILSGSLSTALAKSTYGEASSVASGVPTTLVTFVADPSNLTTLTLIRVAGTNIAKYEVKLNGDVIDALNTYFGGPLYADFNFANLNLATSDVVTVEVMHSRPDVGDFNARVQVVEVTT